MPLVVIQRQLGHAHLGVTSIYLQGIDNAEIIDAVHARRPPMIPLDAKLAAAGIKDLVISVMLGNDRAQHLYERRGVVPAETYLWRAALT